MEDFVLLPVFVLSWEGGCLGSRRRARRGSAGRPQFCRGNVQWESGPAAQVGLRGALWQLPRPGTGLERYEAIARRVQRRSLLDRFELAQWQLQQRTGQVHLLSV